jgi:hypothetical protein
VLGRWARHDHDIGRIAVAKNPTTPPEVLAYLTVDFDYQVRAAAAANSKTPVAALRDCLTDGVIEVRRALAENPSTPLDVIEVLIYHVDEQVAGNAAGNSAWAHATAEQLLTHLVHHPHPLVRETAASEQEPPREGWEILARDRDDAVRVAVAQHTTLDSVLAHLARDPDAQVRKAVAKNPHANPLTLMSLAADSVWPVAKGVLREPGRHT